MAPSVLFALALVVAVNGFEEIQNLTHAEFDGLVMYIAVDKEKVQKKLNDFNDKTFPAGSSRRLSLPAPEQIPLLGVPEGKHVVFIGIGETTDLDFHDQGNDGISLVTKWTEMGVTIPFLTDGVDPRPEYALALGSFYQRPPSGFKVANPNFAFPQIAVDDITLTNDAFEVRHGGEEIRLKLTRYEQCPTVPPIVRHEFQEFMSTVKQIGAEEPHFGICRNHPDFACRLCAIVGVIGDDLEAEVPNFCQTAWSSERRENCNAKIEAVEISPGFREDFLLPVVGDVDIIVDETIHGIFTIGLKYPCLQ